MAAAPKLIEFTVEGTGEFPLDMLRYDSCWPARQIDVSNITPRRAHGTGREPRSVTLTGLLVGVLVGPTAERWRSFGWTVTSTRKLP